MSATEESDNPFRAPKSSDLSELRLRGREDFLVTEQYIVCRNTVELPKICIWYGDSEDLVPRNRVLQKLSHWDVMKIIGITVGVTILNIGVIDGIFTQSTSDLKALFAVCLTISTLFVSAVIIWWFARQGISKVDTTWYICRRYRRRLLRDRVMLAAITFGGVGALGVWTAWELNSLWPLGICLGIATLVSATYCPERKLRLCGRTNGVFLLQGHSEAFCEAHQCSIPDAE